MTICISALFAGREKAIVASDRMITEQRVPVEFEAGEEKMSTYTAEELGLETNLNFVLVTAGSALVPRKIRNELEDRLDQINDLSTLGEELKDIFIDIRKGKFEETVLAPRNYTIESFYDDQEILDSLVGKEIDDALDQFVLDLDIILTGVNNGGARTFRIQDPRKPDIYGMFESFDEIGFDAVGTGANLARDSLTSRYNPSLPKNEALYVVYAAIANASQAPGVGDHKDFCVISSEGIERVEESTKETLREIFEREEGPKSVPEQVSELEL